MVGEAVRALGTGTKSQFAEQLVRDSEAKGEAIDAEKAGKTVNGVWLRLQDRGVITPIKKADVKAGESATEQPADQVADGYDESNDPE